MNGRSYRRALGELVHSDAWVIALARLLQNGNGLVLSVILVRKFGLAAAGSLAIATIPTMVLGAIGTFGLQYTLARERESVPERNFVGLTTSLASLVLAMPIIALFAQFEAHDASEAAAIFCMALAGPFFAQTTIVNALLVLQNKSALIILSPLGNLLGLLVAVTATDQLPVFAMIVGLGRFTGVFSIYFGVSMRAVAPARIFALVQRGLRYLIADLVNLSADQATMVVASSLMNRADLGVYGLLRQLLTACDTLGWSKAVSLYPTLADDSAARLPRLTRSMALLGAGVGAVLCALAVPLGLYFYHIPTFPWLAAGLLASAPARNLVTLYDAMLRALGRIRTTNLVTGIRCCVLLTAVPAGIALGHTAGAVLATAAYAVGAAWLTRRVLLQELAADDRRVEATAIATGPAVEAFS